MTKVPITIIIPIKNEAANLPRCLSSVRWADQVFVVDSQSTDGSLDIVQAFGATTFQFHMKGTWPKKKNWALDHLNFQHEWVFILDADEVLPGEAEAEIRAIVTDPKHPFDGYWINRRFNFMGKWLRHAYYPNWNLRLFRHRLGRYEQMTDSHTNSGHNEVHEHIVIYGKTGHLRTEMDHYAFPSVDVFIEKHNRYSNWEAHVAVSGKIDTGKLQHAHVGWRRRLRAVSQPFPLRPFMRFCYVFFWQRGFLDGMEGYYFARLHGIYEFLALAKTYELRKKQNRPDG